MATKKGSGAARVIEDGGLVMDCSSVLRPVFSVGADGEVRVRKDTAGKRASSRAGGRKRPRSRDKARAR